VCVERGAAVEGFAARLAFVRFFGRMNDLVAAERGRLAETFTAHFTDERTRAGVYRHVPRQIVMGVENFAAIGASKNAVLIGRCAHGSRPFNRPFLAAAVVGHHDVTGWG